MVRLIRVFLVLFLRSTFLFAQWPREEVDITKKSYYKRGLGPYLVAPSFTYTHTIHLNNYLTESNYPTIPSGALNVGFGFNWRFNRLEAGPQVLLGRQSNESLNPQSKIIRRAVTANLPLLYHVLIKEKYSLFGFVGFSGTESSLIASKNTGSMGTIGSILQNPNTSVELNHLSYGTLIGLGVAYQNLFKEDCAVVRLKVGFRVPPREGFEWESKYVSILNAPTDTFPQFLIQLEIGGITNFNK
ncbi:MAG: hypothetical protein ACXIUD_18570 [Mongoliitalea sp.]